MRPAFERLLRNPLAPLALFIAAAGVPACKDDGGIAAVGSAEIAVSPSAVLFDGIAIGETQERYLTISNEGTAELVVSDWHWEGSHDDFSVTGLDDLTIAPDESFDVLVGYAPEDSGIDDATIVIDSNASNDREVRVPVRSLGQAALLATDPGSVELVAEEVGTGVTAELTIYNLGTEMFAVSAISMITGTGEFALGSLPEELPAEVGPQGSITITVTYTPTSGGSDSAEIDLRCDAENCVNGKYTVPVDGIMLTPYLVVSPGFVGFGSVPIGETVTADLLARNQGEAPLRISTLGMAPNPMDGDTEIQVATIDGVAYDPADNAMEIPAGGSSLITLSYTPEDGLADTEALIIRSNDPAFPILSIPVGGTVSAPAIEVFPNPLGFPTTATGLHSDRNLTIRNGGAESLALGPVSQRGDSEFTVLNLASVPAEIAPGEQFDLQVRFAPGGPGEYSGVLIVTSTNDPDTPEVLVPISAVGEAEPDCRVRAVPATVNFGVVPRGSFVEQAGSIQNNGSGPCRVRRVQMQAVAPYVADFSLVSTDPAIPSGGLVLDPGASMNVTIGYMPRTTSLFEDFAPAAGSVLVDVVDDVSGDAESCGAVLGGFYIPPPPARTCGINAQGRGGDAGVDAVPGFVDFGLTTIGCNSQEQEVRVYDTGETNIQVSNIVLEDCTSEFALAGVPMLPVTLTPGNYLSFRVRYRPIDGTADACRAVVTHNAAGGRLAIPLEGEGTTDFHVVDEFTQTSGREVDVLFVIDNSGSMSEEQSSLSDNFDRFISTADLWETDFQLAVITTQVAGNVPDPTGGNAQPGELIGTDTLRIVTRDTPDYEGVFRRMVRVGDSDSMESSDERGLQAAQMALDDPLITDFDTPCDSSCVEPYGCYSGANGAPARCGGPNRTFLRDDASLEIVILSDEEDSSTSTLDYYVDFFRNIKGYRNTSMLHVNAIVGPRGGCSSADGAADSGDRYLDVADRTDGVVASICDSDFATTMTNIGNRAFGLRVQFFLSRVPDPSTVVVRTEGVPTPTGWTYDAESNSIIWSDSAVPSPGTSFEVEYDAACF